MPVAASDRVGERAHAGDVVGREVAQHLSGAHRRRVASPSGPDDGRATGSLRWRSTSTSPGVPSWIDIGSPNPQGAADFYGALFGWEAPEGPPETGGYRVAMVGDRAVAGIGEQQNPGPAGVGHLRRGRERRRSRRPRCSTAGGQVIVPAMDVLDVGRMAIFIDPQGAVFSVWQAGTHPGAELVNEPGTWSWSELLTTDVEAAKGFYGDVFGWTTNTAGAGPTGEYTEWQVNGRSVAGMMQKPPMMPAEVPPFWAVYFAVEDTDAAVGARRPSSAARCSCRRWTSSPAASPPSPIPSAPSSTSSRSSPSSPAPDPPSVASLSASTRSGGATWVRGAMARPRGAKARAEIVRERLALEYPEAICALIHDDAFQLLAATILSAQTTDENVNKVTPALFARYPTPGRPRARRSRRRRAARVPDRLLPLEDQEPARHGAHARGGLRRRGAHRARRPREAPGRRAQDRQRRALGRVRPPGPAGRHPRRSAVAPAQAHHRGRPGEGRARPQRAGAARGARPLLAAAHPARPAGLLRAQARLRTLRAGRHLPVGRSRGRRPRAAADRRA